MKKLPYALICTLTALGLTIAPACNNDKTPSGQNSSNTDAQSGPNDGKTDNHGNNNPGGDNTDNTDLPGDETDLDSDSDGLTDGPRCPNCGLYGTCDENTLTCKCASQFTGSRCDQCAPRFTGPDCDDCADPDTYTGPACNICKNDHKEGSYCERCKKGYWGADCENTCDCPSGEFCQDGINGNGTCSKCSDGKASSKDDGVCDICAPGYYGPDCQPCTCDAIGGTCNDGIDGDGSCTCKEGFTGATCNNCEKGRYGKNCYKCACQNGTCNDGRTSDGSCDCEKNFFGPHCNKQCKAWGENAESFCNIAHGICDDGANGTGNCLSCNTERDGQVHWDINYNCSECLGNWTTVKVGSETKACMECAPGYFGPTCQECGWYKDDGSLIRECNDKNSYEESCDSGLEGTGQCTCKDGDFPLSSYCFDCSYLGGTNETMRNLRCEVKYKSHSYRYKVAKIKAGDKTLNWMMENVRWDGCNSCKDYKDVNGQTYSGAECAECTDTTYAKTPLIQFESSLDDAAMKKWLEDYEGHAKYLKNYGYFLTWEDAKKACPEGWRLPTQAELEAFAEYIAPEDVIMNSDLWVNKPTDWAKEKDDPKDNPNYLGLGALPGGYIGWGINHYYNQDVGEAAYFWGGDYSKYSSINAAVLKITPTKISVTYLSKGDYRLPVRCVKK